MQGAIQQPIHVIPASLCRSFQHHSAHFKCCSWQPEKCTCLVLQIQKKEKKIQPKLNTNVNYHQECSYLMHISGAQVCIRAENIDVSAPDSDVLLRI